MKSVKDLLKNQYFVIFLFFIVLFFLKDSFVNVYESVFLPEQQEYQEYESEEHVEEQEIVEEEITEKEILSVIVSKTATSTELEIEKSGFQAPEIIKAVYLTAWSAASPYMTNYVIDLAKNTEINAVVIDIKDWSGYVSYNTEVAEVEEYNAERYLIPDVKALVEKFHKNGIYTIARISVFQDPILAWSRPDLAVKRKSDDSLLWLDKMGLAWIDPSSEEAWDYNIAIARDVLNQGFDELNFDYIRFPSDGDLGDLSFSLWNSTGTTRISVIKGFYSYLREKLPNAVLSADLFGLSTEISDLGIGQKIEHAYQYFDFVSPMVYPSHYAQGYIGYDNPAEYPYEVVKNAMEAGLFKLNAFKTTTSTQAKLRPWLQDFDLGAEYGEEEVRLEINAVQDALKDDFSGFMIWSPENFYTRGALSTTTQDLLE
ncbi:MAG: putative glycoside hydrolase [Patescibacteria group bacterium]|nr:putative glycoside hydrolase [Patescibacteria group bacterium]